MGRGQFQSHCVLISDDRGEEARQRLEALVKTNDGFLLAEEDLRLRGPGDFFGHRQHGLPNLRLADLAGDMRVLKQAQTAAQDLLAADPGLHNPAHAPLLAQVHALFSANPDIFN